MATTSAAAAPATPSGQRPLWQVPTFLVGLMALGGAVLARSLCPVGRCPCCELHQARKLLERSDPDARKALALSREYLQKAGEDDERTGEAWFLIGLSEVILARQSDPASAEARWRQARDSLEKAEKLGVTGEDSAALQFYLAQCLHHTRDDPRKVIDRLNRCLDEIPQKVEAHQLLVQAYLDLRPANLEAALKANEKLRQLPLVGEEVLGPARVQAGELLLRLNRPADARKVLKNVGPMASPEVQLQARTLTARAHQAQKQWAEAAGVWQEVLNSPLLPAGQRPHAHYNLGVCLHSLGQIPEALQAWRTALEQDKGEVARAAALRLAEQMIRDRDGDAVPLYARAVDGLSGPDDWKNSLLNLTRARQAFEAGYAAHRERGNPAGALELARHYGKLAAPGVASLLQGQAAEAWAQELLQNRGDPGKIRDLFHQAGMSYRASAEATPARIDQADRLWLAATAFVRAGEHALAIPLWRRYLDLGQRPEKSGEAWYRLGEAYRERHMPAAEAAYQEAVKVPGRFASRARYHLAQAERRRGHVDACRALLEQNVKELRLEPDDEALENSLFLLGRLVCERRDCKTARLHLEEAVGKFPQSRWIQRGRYHLADAYRNLAALETKAALSFAGASDDTKRHHEEQARVWLSKAVEQYRELARTLDQPGLVFEEPLTAQEQTLAWFREVECQFDLGQYQIALAGYQRLAERFRGRVERLHALAGTIRCHVALGQPERVKSRFQEIRDSLSELDEATRKQWEDWLTQAGG